MRVIGLAAAVTSSWVGSAVAQDVLVGEALRTAVAGKTIHLETPIGTVPVAYAPNGTLYGRGGGVAAYLGASEDRGRWWVSSQQLCQRWNVWLDAKPHCYTIRRDGDRVQWTRDDGRTGSARITGRGAELQR
jgi:hypothetical protein